MLHFLSNRLTEIPFFKLSLVLLASFCFANNLPAQEVEENQPCFTVAGKYRKTENGKNRSFENGPIEIFKNDSIIDTAYANNQARFEICLDFGAIYILQFREFKPGYFPKSIEFDLTGITTERINKGFDPFDFTVALLEDSRLVDFSFFETNVVGRIFYDPKIGEFDYDTEYTRSIQKVIDEKYSEASEYRKIEDKIESKLSKIKPDYIESLLAVEAEKAKKITDKLKDKINSKDRQLKLKDEEIEALKEALIDTEKELKSEIKTKDLVLAKTKLSLLDELEEVKDQKSFEDAVNQLEIDRLNATTQEDSLRIEERERRLALLKDEIQNREIIIGENEKVIEEKQTEVETKSSQLLYTILGLALLLILSVFVLISERRQRAAKKLISAQKAEIEIQKREVDESHELLSEKNQEITDSITYAKRIQEAILPPARLVKAALPNSFVLYKPKDIVAGDFYWMETVGDLVIFAAADCTGHGVPGAMVSVVCSNALNRAVREFGLTEPAKILDKTLELVIERFEKSEEEVKDGMDLALCALNKKTNELQYAGANNPLWIIKGESADLQETKATKQPVGKYADPKPYVNHSIQLSVGDSIYIFSDGYPDQFGGEKGKKLKTKAFKELLISIQNKSMNEQYQIVDDYFENWRGDQEQIDDVCVIGVRV